MAIIQCPSCGSNISNQAVQCPKCGCQIQGSENQYQNSTQGKDQRGRGNPLRDYLLPS